MSTNVEIPNNDALIAEQATVQAEKFQGRTLAEYSSYIFPGQILREPSGSAVVDLVRPFIGDSQRATLDGLLEGMIEEKSGEPVNWVDMGGGRALPMRQLGSMPDFKQKLKMTNVDLFNFGIGDLEPSELEYLQSLAIGITDPEAEPRLVMDNIETVTLPEPADVITSIETMQYLNNPLKAMANWYNQLADNGLMFVATQHNWAGWVRYDSDPTNSEPDATPMGHFLEELSRAGINVAVTDEGDRQSGYRPEIDPDRFRIMAIEKKPGTSIEVTRPPVKVWINPFNFKAAYYKAPSEESSPIIEVRRTDINTALGAVTLGNIH